MANSEQRYPAPVPRGHRRRSKLGTVLVLAVLLLVGLLVYVDLSLHREDAIAGSGERPEDGPGTNWLLVGSDSREGLDDGERAELGTGDAQGRRTDTVIVVHIPAGAGKPTMVSLPRDSYVPIPGHGKDKLNAAYAYGGPPLLTDTVETATGVRIDHYAEIGLGGFAGLTDAVGGVELCVEERMRDPKANLDLQPGCQEVDGPQALGYVRTRASARGDLDRVEHQRQYLAALADRVSDPTVWLNPFRGVPLVLNASNAFRVDEQDHVWHLARLAFAMNGLAAGDGVTTTVPFGGFGTTSNGSSVVQWDTDKAKKLFAALASDEPVPQDVIAGTTTDGG